MASTLSQKSTLSSEMRSQKLEILLKKAVSLHQQGQLEKTQQLYKQILREDPDNVVTIQLSGVLAYQTNHFDLSLNLLSRAISIKPNYAAAYGNRGHVLQKLGRFDEALADFDRAISIKPDYVDAYSHRGDVFRCHSVSKSP